MSFTKEQLAYHAVWRKALADGSVEIRFKTLADARRVRFGLYNALRPFKEGKLHDPDLLRAGQECAIQLAGTVLTVVKKLETGVMQSVMEALGVTPESLEAEPAASEMPAEARESLSKVLALIGMPSGPAEGAEVVPGPARERLDYGALLAGKGGWHGDVE